MNLVFRILCADQNIFTLLHLIITLRINITHLLLSSDRVSDGKYQHAKVPEYFTQK